MSEGLDDLEREAAAEQSAEKEKVEIHESEPGTGGESLGPGPELLNELPTWKVLDQLLAPLLGLWCPNWEITAGERQAVAVAWGDVIDKWFPDGPPIGPELTAALVTISVFGSRAGIPRKARNVTDTGTGTEAPAENDKDKDYSREF